VEARPPSDVPPLVAISGIYCRVTRECYAPLDTTGSAKLGGRFNPPGVPAQYQAADPHHAMLESVGSQDWVRFDAFAPRRIVCVRLDLSRVVDLSEPTTLAATGLDASLLVEDWTASAGPSHTQLFGETLLEAGVEAIRYPSARDPRRTNLAVFRDNLLENSRLDLVLDGDD
jgi:RES domain-containing protein